MILHVSCTTLALELSLSSGQLLRVYLVESPVSTEWWKSDDVKQLRDLPIITISIHMEQEELMES